MKKLPIYQIDAFAESLFTGNPAAVVVLEEWLSAELMQKIGAENNLSETAFIVNNEDGFDIRWFTPSVEVELCGHATLASAYVCFNHLNLKSKQVKFKSLYRGTLIVEKEGDRLVLDFPSDEMEPAKPPLDLLEGLGEMPLEMYKGKTDYLLIYENQKQIEQITPDFGLIAKARVRGVIISAPGEDVDFVSRFFAPRSGVNEDPVTGSAHTSLIPYWSKRLDKKEMIAKQISKRSGLLYCQDEGARVKIGGSARLYLVGEIEV